MTDEFNRGGFGQHAGGMLPVDLTLHPDMRARLKLEIAPLAGCLELILECPDDFPGVVLWPSIRFE